MPLMLSVVMSIYNGDKFLKKSIESVLTQTYIDFEFIIINDSSTDNTLNIIEEYSFNDKRIRIIDNHKRLGLTQSLNDGLKQAKGNYIARMDADDICLPHRFESQITFLIEHPEILIVGGDVITIDSKDREMGVKKYTNNPYLLRWNMLFGYGATLCHPAVMMRRRLFQETGYYSDYKTSQDLELWSRLFWREKLPIVNLDEVVLKYRIHDLSVSINQNTTQSCDALDIHKKLLSDFLGESIDDDVIQSYKNTLFNNSKERQRFIIQIWLDTFIRFIKSFHPASADKFILRKKLLGRISSYMSINPFNIFSSKRLCLWRDLFLLKGIYLSDFWEIFKLKFEVIKSTL